MTTCLKNNRIYIGGVASAPTTNVEAGDLYYNSDEDVLYRRDGNSTWVEIGSGSGITISPTEIDINVGRDKGKGWFDTTRGGLYIWDEQSWIEILDPESASKTYISNTEPAADGQGDYWYNSNNGELHIWDGGTWRLITASPTAYDELDELIDITNTGTNGQVLQANGDDTFTFVDRVSTLAGLSDITNATSTTTDFALQANGNGTFTFVDRIREFDDLQDVQFTTTAGQILVSRGPASPQYGFVENEHTLEDLTDVPTIPNPETTTISVTASGGKFYLGGIEQSSLTLYEGSTYIFDQSNSSNTGHPLRFSTTFNGTHSGGSEYTTGVTYSVASPGQSQSYTQIVVPSGAPTLYYYCANHSQMGGTITTSGQIETGQVLSYQHSTGDFRFIAPSANAAYGATAPSNPVVGQLWFDTGDSNTPTEDSAGLFVWDGYSWVSCGSPISLGAAAPPVPDPSNMSSFPTGANHTFTVANSTGTVDISSLDDDDFVVAYLVGGGGGGAAGVGSCSGNVYGGGGGGASIKAYRKGDLGDTLTYTVGAGGSGSTVSGNAGTASTLTSEVSGNEWTAAGGGGSSSYYYQGVCNGNSGGGGAGEFLWPLDDGTTSTTQGDGTSADITDITLGFNGVSGRTGTYAGGVGGAWGGSADGNNNIPHSVPSTYAGTAGKGGRPTYNGTAGFVRIWYPV